MTLINKLAKEFVDTYDNNRNDPECVKKYKAFIDAWNSRVGDCRPYDINYTFACLARYL